MEPIKLNGVGFARLDEYFGLWAMEPSRFRLAWDRASKMDIKAHIADTGPIKAEVYTDVVPISSVSTDGNILLIQASGVLMKQVPSGESGSSTILLRRVLREAAADDSVAGVILIIDSPGGTVSGTSDLAADISAAKLSKPVWAYIEDLGASAAYWCAAACDRIIANHRTAAIGSIGTILGLYDSSAAAEKQGVEAVVISTGSLKGAGFPGAPITADQKAYFQQIIDATQTSFSEAVMQGRGLSTAAVNELADGGVWLADQAMELGLIDGIDSLENVVQQMKNELTQGGKTANIQKEDAMSSARKSVAPKAEAVAPKADDVKPETETIDEPVIDEPVVDEPVVDEPVAVEPEPAAVAPLPDGKAFMAAFGTAGAVWYAEGKSFAEARDLHIEALVKENTELKAKLDTLDRGAVQPLKITGEASPESDPKFSSNLGQNLGRFAAGVKLPAKK